MASTEKKTITIALVYPNQLFEKSGILKELDMKKDAVLLIEDDLFFEQYDFHPLKIEFHKRTMSFYKSFLEEKGYVVHVVKTLDEGLAVVTKRGEVSRFVVYDVVDNYLDKKIRAFSKKHHIELDIGDTPMFVTTNSDMDDYLALHKTAKQKFFMKNFYEWQRKRLGILVDDKGLPVGGRWSFDEDNRKKVPKDLIVPAYSPAYPDFPYATNFKDARVCLKDFLKNRLSSFGPYEDAVMQENHTVFHSVLTPYLNVGLLTPDEVVEAALSHAKKVDVPLQSLEGFIRQVIGWREYIRMVYVHLGTSIRNKNYFNAKRKIPKSFWTGDTGIAPVDNTIQAVNEYAYTHHIPRLMIMGNFMNLCGFDPHEVYRWFMERYIDSYDWVMVPNVYSMALYADGGMITTKPYISGSSYVLKMSDFKKSPGTGIDSWNHVWDALFWSFVGKHFEKMKAEGRLGFIGVQYAKMSKEKKDGYDQLAEKYLKMLH